MESRSITAAKEAGTRDLALPLAHTQRASLDEAVSAGWGERDCSWLPAFWAAKSDR